MRTTAKTALLFMAMTIASHAIPITPTTGTWNTDRWEGTTGPGQTAIDLSLNGIVAGIVDNELYKYDGADSGALAGSYATVLTPTADPTGGTITYGTGNHVGSPAYLLLKGGNSTPVWYFYDLTALNWNGTDTIQLSGFWDPGQGAISHVTLYGTSTTGGGGGGAPRVPDGGTTFLLLGSALTGLGVLRRKFGAKLG